MGVTLSFSDSSYTGTIHLIPPTPKKKRNKINFLLVYTCKVVLGIPFLDVSFEESCDVYLTLANSNVATLSSKVLSGTSRRSCWKGKMSLPLTLKFFALVAGRSVSILRLDGPVYGPRQKRGVVNNY